MKKIYTLIVSGLLATVGLAQSISLDYVSSYSTGLFDEGAAEIVTYEKLSHRLFFSNASDNSIGILDFSDPANLSLISQIDLSAYGDGVNSVSAYNGVIAVAVQGEETMDRGHIVFFDSAGTFLSQVEAGYLPDMVTFSHDGMMVVAANEGEPNDDWTEDPVGSITIIDVSGGIAGLTQTNVTELVVGDYSGSWEGVRFFPGDFDAANLEPEYVAVSEDNSTAFVSLQENNAVVVVDLTTKTITDVQPLGTKDHSIAGNGLDASDKDDEINITTYPFKGLYLPDALTTIDIAGTTYYLTANEGDSRDYDGYSEEERLEDLDLDSIAFPNAATLQLEENGGRMKVTTSMGDTDGDGDYDEIYTYGTRSFSIWSTTGTLVYDSGDEFEQQLATLEPDNFGSTNDENDSFDNRSDDKGPEPEAIEVATINGEHYAFIGLERIGGIMMYNITNPTAPTFVQYINNRDFSVEDVTTTAVGDLGCEDVLFIDGQFTADSNFYLVTSNEVSGSVSVFQIVGAVGVEQIKVQKEFKVYPNPATNVLNISTKDNYNIIDISGRRIISGSNTNLMKIETLATGVYAIENESGATQMFVKQ